MMHVLLLPNYSCAECWQSLYVEPAPSNPGLMHECTGWCNQSSCKLYEIKFKFQPIALQVTQCE
jgi:hypothetical protein